jgi:ABC-type iron transport system FetAB ATPase subunit
MRNPKVLKLQAAIRRVVRAEIAHSWRGAQAPEDYLAIAQELSAAKRNLRKIIKELRIGEKQIVSIVREKK